MRASRVGATLFELLIWLCFLGVLLTIAFPKMQRGLDALAVRTARESAFALISRARMIALQEGGAEVRLDAGSDRVLVRSNNGVFRYEQPYDEHEVDLLLDGSSTSATLRYDAHGVGRMSSRTIRFRAGAAEAGLTVSSYGRVRRW